MNNQNNKTIRWDGSLLEVGKIYLVENAMTGGVIMAPTKELYDKSRENYQFWVHKVMEWEYDESWGIYKQDFFEGYNKEYQVIEKSDPTTITLNYADGPKTWINNYPVKLKSKNDKEFWINAYGTSFTPMEKEEKEEENK